MAYLWAESLFKLIKPQARPIIVEEAKAYIERGVKNANDRPWWPLRSMLRSLSLFCNDEQIADCMISTGLLQYLKTLTYHKENSLCVQICRILSELTFQNNYIGVRSFIHS